MMDLMRRGFLSAAHTPDLVEETVQAFDRTLARLQAKGVA